MFGLSGLKLYGAIAGVLIILAIIGTVIGWRLKAARLEKAQDVVGESVPKEEGERRTLTDTLSDADKIQAAREEERAFWHERDIQQQEALRRRDVQIQQLLSRQQQEQSRVAALRDEELEPEIKARLGLRRPDDVARSGFLPAELQALAQCVNQYPLCRERLAEQERKTQELDGRVEAMEGQLTALSASFEQERRKTEAFRTYSLQLLGHYREAVNAIGLKKRGGKCLFLWKCGERKLPVPKPEELAAQAPEP